MTILIIDVETTGLDCTKDRIIEVGAVAFDLEGNELASMSQIVDPGWGYVPSHITEITGINQEMIYENGIPFNKVAKKLYSWCKRASYLGGHNFSFDVGFLNTELVRSGYSGIPEKKWVDTLEISRRYLSVGSKKLGALCEFYDVDLENAHRAVHDCRATGILLFKIMEDLDIDLESNDLIFNKNYYKKSIDIFSVMLENQRCQRG